MRIKREIVNGICEHLDRALGDVHVVTHNLTIIENLEDNNLSEDTEFWEGVEQDIVDLILKIRKGEYS